VAASTAGDHSPSARVARITALMGVLPLGGDGVPVRRNPRWEPCGDADVGRLTSSVEGAPRPLPLDDLRSSGCLLYSLALLADVA